MGAGLARFAPFVRGRPAPTAGKICMDLSMIDLSGIPEARPGDEVDIFGVHPRVEDLAAACAVIPYAILTGISPRVKRIYIHEG
jgi:alanine racemase